VTVRSRAREPARARVPEVMRGGPYPDSHALYSKLA